jgi:hypothetical protein
MVQKGGMLGFHPQSRCSCSKSTAARVSIIMNLRDVQKAPVKTGMK